jgi:hypothetical protein
MGRRVGWSDDGQMALAISTLAECVLVLARDLCDDRSISEQQLTAVEDLVKLAKAQAGAVDRGKHREEITGARTDT